MLTFKVRGPKDAASISVVAGSTLLVLKEEIRRKLQEVPPCFDLLLGFPPQLLSLDDDTVIDGHIAHNESLRVQKKDLQGQQAQGTSPAPKNKAASSSSKKASTTTSGGNSNTTGGIKTLQPMKTTTKASSSSSKSTTAGSSFGARIATLSSGTKTSSNSSGAAGSRGGRGGFGSLSSSSSNATRKKTVRAPRVSNTASSEADISEHLIAAVSGGGSSRDKVLRKVFRNAVEHQYNSAKALARLSAVYSGQYTINENANARLLNSGVAVKMDVRFQKGGGSRTYFEETVDLLPDEVLLELLKIALQDTEGAGREVLKPMNLSKCSPRIFWSLVYKHGQNLTQTIKTLLQGIDDCSWLTERKKELSEKARENLRQQQEKEAAANQRKAKKRKAGDEEKDNDLVDLTEGNAQGEEPAPQPPVLLQESELQALQSISFVEVVPEEWMDQVRALLGSEQALSLANVSNVNDFTNKLNTTSLENELSEDQVESWIQSAQSVVLQAFWCRICGGGCERLRKVLYGLRIRVPKSFLTWKSAAEGLHKGIISADPVLKEIKIFFNGSVAVFTVDVVKWMVQCCADLIQSFAWVNQHDNIIEEDGEEDENEAENDATEAEEDWLMNMDAHSFMGKRGRLIVREVATQIEDIATSYHNMGFWEDGSVIAYLPATEEEPMALWRVQLDPAKKQGSTPRVEDLEEEEVLQAIQRFPSDS